MTLLLQVLRALMLVGGLAGMAVAAWAFVDPAAFPALGEARGMLGAPPSPRWRAVLLFVLSLAIAAFGAGLLRHRELP
jgi:hypothetical protein